jgi:1-acyl-sn-glycerol-3-phosphate acyltransferase
MSSIELPRETAGIRSRESAPARALWSLWNALQLVFMLLWTGVGIVIVLTFAAVARSPRIPLRAASRVWAPGLLLGAGVRFSVEGAEAVDWSRTYMIVANHQSVIDTCALFRAVPVPLRFVLKQEMTRVPLVGQYAKATGMLFIDRDSRRAGPKMLRDAAALLRMGASVCFFPEGTRSRDGRVGAFKTGAFHAAIDAGVDVLPVTIIGADAVLPTEGLFRVRPGAITVRIGAPMSTAGRDRQTLAEEAQAAVVAMLERGHP